MTHEVDLNTTFGRVIGFARSSPLSKMASVIVKVNNKTIRIPVDYRQIKFIGNEYPIGSVVELEYNDRWRIISKMAPVEFDINSMFRSEF